MLDAGTDGAIPLLATAGTGLAVGESTTLAGLPAVVTGTIERLGGIVSDYGSAEGNGVVAMRAQVVTSGGHPVGTPVDFTITAAQSGRVAWIIIVASGVVLLGATAYRVRSMHRENQEG